MSFPVQVFRCSHLWPPGVSGPGPAASLPVPVPAGLHRPAGLPAAAVCHRVRRAEAHRPGWREPEGDGLSDGRRLHAAVSAAKLLSALLGSGLVWASEREEEHLQRLQVLHKHFALTVDVWSIENRLSWHLTEGSKDKQVEKWIRIYWVWGFMGHPRSRVRKIMFCRRDLTGLVFLDPFLNAVFLDWPQVFLHLPAASPGPAQAHTPGRPHHEHHRWGRDSSWRD